MNKLRLVLGVVALAVATSAGAQTKLKWAHVYETSEAYHTAAVWAAGEIKKRTNGRYEVEVFPASSLGKETDINQGLTLGTRVAATRWSRSPTTASATSPPTRRSTDPRT